jgi:hypothetical protein
MIESYERRLGFPGTVSAAFLRWSLFVDEPGHRLHDQEHVGCDYPECCGDPYEARSILEAAAHVLPRQDARRFRRRLATLDEKW